MSLAVCLVACGGSMEDGQGATGTTTGQHALMVDVPENGNIASVPPGIDCGPSCSAQLADGSKVHLTATPAPGYEFATWTGGACTNPVPVCDLDLWVDVRVGATFRLTQPGN